MTPRRAFFLGFWLVALFVPADLVAQQIKTIEYEALASYYGLTYCTDKGVYSVIAVGLSAMDEADVKAHELKHQDQFRRLKLSCRDFQRYYHRPKNKLDMETEAYAAGYCVQVSMGADRLSLFQLYVERIQVLVMGGGVNRLEVALLLKKYVTALCPKALP
jgi:hypothetical protein